MTNSRDLANLGGGFIQAGGGVQRSVESKLQDIVSVKDFGAKGDGVTNDTAAIQAALNSAKSVFFPRGQYNITSTLIVGQNARLVGELPQSNGQASPNEVLIYGTVENIGDGNPLVRLHAGTYTANQSVQTRRQAIVIENIAFSSNKSVDYSNLSATTSNGVTGVDVSSVKDGLEFIQCSFSRMAYGVRQYTLEPYLDKVTFTRCHFTLLYTAIECGPTAGLSLDNTWIYDCYDWVNAQARNNSIPVPSPSTLHSNRGAEVFANASTFQNSSASSNYACISANAITAIGCWFEGGNNWLNPTYFARAESCYFSEAIPVTGSRFSILPAGNSCTIVVNGCRIGSSTRIINFENVTDKKTISVTCIGNYNGTNFSEPSQINTHLSAGLDYEGYGNWNAPAETWNISQHDRDIAIGKALPEARLHLLKNTAGAGLYVRLTDTSTSGGKAGIIFERTQTNAGDFKVEDVLGELVVSSSNDATTWTDRVKLTSAWAWAPAADNTQSLGTSSLKWSVVYAGTGTINTSDANEKQQIAALTATEQNVAQRLKGLIHTFKFNDAVVAKGDDARIHVGVIAQDVADAFIQEGLDPTRYGIFCKDTYYTLAGVPVVTEGDEPIPDGAIQVERLGIRYEELLAFIIAAL